MTIQYASDLHLGIPKNEPFMNATPLNLINDILLLVGEKRWIKGLF